MARTVVWYRVMVEYESDAPMEDVDLSAVTDQLETALSNNHLAGDLDPEHFTIEAIATTVDMTSSEDITPR